MKKFVAAVVAMSVSALLCATTEAAKTTEKTTEKPAEKTSSVPASNKQATPATVAQTAPSQILAQATVAPATSTMTADEQTFCNKLNAKCQQTFKSMDSVARQACMEAAKSKDANQACEDAAKVVAKK